MSDHELTFAACNVVQKVARAKGLKTRYYRLSLTAAKDRVLVVAAKGHWVKWRDALEDVEVEIVRDNFGKVTEHRAYGYFADIPVLVSS